MAPTPISIPFIFDLSFKLERLARAERGLKHRPTTEATRNCLDRAVGLTSGRVF